jgi:hypothetical protein
MPWSHQLPGTRNQEAPCHAMTCGRLHAQREQHVRSGTAAATAALQLPRGILSGRACFCWGAATDRQAMHPATVGQARLRPAVAGHQLLGLFGDW